MSEMTCGKALDLHEGRNKNTYLAHNRVDGSVEAQCLSDDMVQLSKVFEVFVRHVTESAIRVSELFLLLLVEFLPAALLAFMHRVGKPDLPDISLFSQMKQCPRARRRRSVLASHQKGDHHVRDIRVGQRSAVFVCRALQCRDHVVFMLRRY